MPQFRYDAYRDPMAGTLIDLIGRANDPRARAAERIGQAQAQAAQNIGLAQAHAAQQSGDVWGNAIAHIGQSVAAIPGQMQQQKRQAADDQIRAQQLKAGQLDIQRIEQGQTDLAALDKVFATPGGWDAVLEATPGHLRPQVIKQRQEADQFAENARKSKAAARKDRDEYFGKLGAEVRASGYDPAYALGAVHHALQVYDDDPQMIQQINQMRMQIIEQPESVRQITDAAIMGSSFRDLLKPERPVEHDPTKELRTPGGNLVVPAVPKVEPPKVDTRSLQLRADEANAKGDTVEYNRLLKVIKDTGQADDRPRVPAAGGGQSDDVKLVVQGMREGTLPPQMPGRASKDYTAIMAEAKRQGYDLAGAAIDWAATTKHVNTMNGAQQLRLNQAVNALPEMLDSVDALASKWKGGRFPVLNKANLALAKGGAYGQEVAAVATQLDAQIADVVADLGNVYMGGNSPTDHALSLAGKSLSGEWSEKVLHDMVALAKKNVTIRQNSIRNTGVAGASEGNPYAAPRQQETSGGMVKMKAPNGQVQDVPADQVDHFKSRGATVVK